MLRVRLTSSPSNTHTHPILMCVCVMTEATVSLPRTIFTFHGAQGVEPEVDFCLDPALLLQRLVTRRPICDSLRLHSGTGVGSLEHESYSAFVKNSNINSVLERMSQETLLNQHFRARINSLANSLVTRGPSYSSDR